MGNERIYSMSFASVYPLYVAKAERKGRSKDEVDQIICWLTGYQMSEVERHLIHNSDVRTFFEQATGFNPLSKLISGKVCGVAVEEVEDPIMQRIRYLDKLIDELAKGRPMRKILREL